MVGASRPMINSEGTAVAMRPLLKPPMTLVNHKLTGTAAIPTPAVAPRISQSEAGAFIMLDALGASDRPPDETGTSGASSRALWAEATGAISITITIIDLST